MIEQMFAISTLGPSTVNKGSRLLKEPAGAEAGVLGPVATAREARPRTRTREPTTPRWSYATPYEKPEAPAEPS